MQMVVEALKVSGGQGAQHRGPERFSLVMLLSDEVVRELVPQEWRLASEKTDFSLPNVTERERKVVFV